VDVAVVRIIPGDGGADTADSLGRFVELLSQREGLFLFQLREQLLVNQLLAVLVGGPAAAMERARAAMPRVLK
jgi:hypothetical protein